MQRIAGARKLTKLRLIDRRPESYHFKRDTLRGPADAAQQVVERNQRAGAVQFDAVQAPREIEEMPIDLPASRGVLGPEC